MIMIISASYSFYRLLSENRTILMCFSIICIMLYHQNWVVSDLFNQYMQIEGYQGNEKCLCTEYIKPLALFCSQFDNLSKCQK